MKKRIITLVLLVVFCLCVVGCPRHREDPIDKDRPGSYDRFDDIPRR